MEIRHKEVRDLTPVEYRACYRANFGDEGYMQEELSHCRSGRPGRVIMLWDGPDDTTKSLIGWALLTPVRVWGLIGATHYTKTRSRYSVQMWVKRQYRRKGYGKVLMREVKKLDSRPHVFPHDEISAEFYSGYNVTVLDDDRKRWMRGKPKVS